MPYRHAHYYVGFVLLVILTGFWASYFAPIGSVPLAFHVHAVTAMTWLGFLIVQHVSIHRRMNALHRQVGLASFALFPLLIVGLTMIINFSADRLAANEGEFIAYAGPSFAIGMVIAIVAYLTLFYLALKNRRNVKLHAGYMLATPLILFESPFSRVMGDYLPWMNVIGSEGPQAIFDTIAISDTLATIFALALYFRDRKNGAPWLVASAFMMTQAVVMWVTPGSAAVREIFRAYAAVPDAVTLSVAALLGLAACWFGWKAAPSRPRRPEMPAAA
ncbi:hypothetical protein A6F68_00537 [Tsuneonella dongtanensis]|uniref:Uncharacterized protein n=1 Tax=Tsuneonella dongtanensis TaxID=692370 RepID=A0A1B2AAB4_9SPHN|nr:hypothetical protein [Tsuneonella dongtanensis]ANY19072.1 hypothetical protein A6F68_00537 [Tsuneonella dongtanensis]